MEAQEVFKDFVIKLSDGNPGCMMFVIQALHETPERAVTALERAQLYDLKGSRLYMLWNDCCNRNTKVAVNILLEESMRDIRRHVSGGYGMPFENYVPVGIRAKWEGPEEEEKKE